MGAVGEKDKKVGWGVREGEEENGNGVSSRISGKGKRRGEGREGREGSRAKELARQREGLETSRFCACVCVCGGNGQMSTLEQRVRSEDSRRQNWINDKEVPGST